VADAARLITDALSNGNKLLICGNGGSAADAQHFAAELVGKFLRTRRPLPAMALTTNSSTITAIGNDISFGSVFLRQVEALGREDDILVCITTSAASRNVIRAARKASRLGLGVVALTGRRTDPLRPYADVVIAVPSRDTPRIQEMHALTLHVICHVVEQALLE